MIQISDSNRVDLNQTFLIQIRFIYIHVKIWKIYWKIVKILLFLLFYMKYQKFDWLMSDKLQMSQSLKI